METLTENRKKIKQSETDMTSEQKIDLKTRLINKCIEMQNGLTDTAYKAMKQAQETANEEKGTMEDKFESFREQMQIERDMFAKIYDEALTTLENLKKINTARIQNAAAAGTVIITPEQKYFVAHSLGKVQEDGETYMAISPASPIFKAMAGKKKGETFIFRDKKVPVTEVF